MRSLCLFFAVAVAGLALGCGPGDPKPAGKPTDEAIKADLAAQKIVEDEEKGPRPAQKTK